MTPFNLREQMAQNRRELVKRRDELYRTNPEAGRKMDKVIAAFDRQNLIFLSQVERDKREGVEMARTILIWAAGLIAVVIAALLISRFLL